MCRALAAASSEFGFVSGTSTDEVIGGGAGGGWCDLGCVGG